MCKLSSEEYDAIDALEEQGHQTITLEMVEAWIAAKRQAEKVPQQAEGEPSWTSFRPPVSDEATNPDGAHPRRKRGRPARNDWWIYAAAQFVAAGSTLTQALRRLGMIMSRAERKNVYRLKLFREAVQRERKRLEIE